MEDGFFEKRVFHRAGDEDGCGGGWTCSRCSGAIERLPFKPDPARLSRLLCLNCYRDSRNNVR